MSQPYPSNGEEAVEERNETRLESAEKSLAGEVETLIMAAERLAQRLEPVTKTNPPRESGDSKLAEQSLGESQHLRFMQKTLELVRSTRVKLEDLRERLEV